MRIGLELEKNYSEYFMNQFLARTSMDITFVVIEGESNAQSCNLIVSDRPQKECESVENRIFLVEEETSEASQICKLQRFSFVYAQIMKHIISGMKQIGKNTMPVVCVLGPGSEEKRNGVSLALSSCLAEKWERVAYLSTEGIDINDRILDSPQDEGFTKLFLHSKDKAIITHFSFQHAHHFYFLGAARSRKDKRSIGTEGYRHMLKRFRQEEAFDCLVIELSQELSEAEMWLITQSDVIVCIRGSTIYETVKWQETLKRLTRECPSLTNRCLHLSFGQDEKVMTTCPCMPDEEDCFNIEDVSDFYRESSIGIEFDPGRTLIREMQPFVDYMLERMMS